MESSNRFKSRSIEVTLKNLFDRRVFMIFVFSLPGTFHFIKPKLCGNEELLRRSCWLLDTNPLILVSK